MKKLLFLSAAVCLFSFAAMAENADYSGTWKLDSSKSKLDERMRVESITMTVAQADNALTVDTATKRLPPNDGGGAPPGGGGAGGGRGMGGGRGGFGGGDGKVSYTLDGKETKVDVTGPNGPMPVSYKGSKGSDGSLKLSSSRSFSGPQGEISITTKETWKLSDGGKTLTVERESTNPRGTTNTTLVFTKG